MLREFIKRMSSELQLDTRVEMNKEKIIEFYLSPAIKLHFKELDPGVSVQATIASCPEKRKEDLFILLMRANFLGQGTGGSRIGLDMQEKFLTLSLSLPYELDYSSFKQHVEDFVNYLNFWKDKIAEFEQEKPLI